MLILNNTIITIFNLFSAGRASLKLFIFSCWSLAKAFNGKRYKAVAELGFLNNVSKTSEIHQKKQ